MLVQAAQYFAKQQVDSQDSPMAGEGAGGATAAAKEESPQAVLPVQESAAPPAGLLLLDEELEALKAIASEGEEGDVPLGVQAKLGKMVEDVRARKAGARRGPYDSAKSE